MATDHRIALAKIKRFDQLIAYLRDEMGWPIARDSFEDVDDLFYDFTAAELGIDVHNSAKIQEIKRLRPLSSSQPWGIFFVKFEPKTLPIVALRRILGQVALKKRSSANNAERAAWAADDLLFISNYGEGDERQISFAHFSKAPQGQDLPTLKVLGWDNLDTALHLDSVARELTQNLAWPDDEEDISAWRANWRAAFTLRHREVVRTSQQLSIRLAELARSIRDRIKAALAIETEVGPLTKLMKAFQEALVHDLDADGFADMYAQTIAYGLLSARIADPERKTADDFAAHMRTNPFLRELMETFLKVGGRRGKAGGPGIDFDELGVSEVVELLDDAKMEAVVRDFGDKNRQEDPVIHFYELFLKEYDAKKRMQRGVFYTPRQVVSYIVRSVHELLRTEFKLQDGLADITSWKTLALNNKKISIPNSVSADEPFVQILDPATGTGTFLVEVIDVIYETMISKWKREGRTGEQINTLWNVYVPKYLLPRIHGYELMMAPYTIAHLKIGLKLHETGYAFGADERARVYLTNALEPAHDYSDRFSFTIPALAHEAQAVNSIKTSQRFTVVLGNPPYSGHSWNLTPELRRLVEPYRSIGGQRIKEKGALQLEKSIQDDYVKFVRFAELNIAQSSLGIVGLVTSHGFLDNPFLRGMRSSIISTFSKLFVLDLHGNALRREQCPDGSVDKNVFDIKRTGVAISLLRRSIDVDARSIEHADLWGDRDLVKYPWLGSHSIESTATNALDPGPASYLLVPEDKTNLEEYERGFSIGEIMPVHSKGIVTGRDAFVTDFDEDALLDRMKIFANSKKSDDRLVEEFGLNPTEWWNVKTARANMPSVGRLRDSVRPLLYRPFDVRACFYHPAVLMSPRRPVMKHMDSNRFNLLLITSRMTKGEAFRHIAVADGLTEAIFLSSKTSNNAIVFPLYIYPESGALEFSIDESREPNFTKEFRDAVRLRTGLQPIDGRGDYKTTIGFEDIFSYFVAVLHSPTYRIRYAAPLSREFPRLPLTGGLTLLRKLVELGDRLIASLLLKPTNTGPSGVKFVGDEMFEIEKVSWSNGVVWVDRENTTGFEGVPEAVWSFQIGGYQVCEKWLKDRRGRILSQRDIAQYKRIVASLTEIISLMSDVDVAINAHGSWSEAFDDSVAAGFNKVG